MRQFLQHHGEQILGVLSGFDRLRLRGALRLFVSEGGVVGWLQQAGIALKDFLTWAEGLTQRLRRRTEQAAKTAGRPVQYLDRFVDKEEHVAQIRAERGAADSGLVTVLSTLETCRSFELHRYRDSGRCELRRKLRKCLHYYYYGVDGRFGLTQVRIETWFPFDVHVVLNGREWLARVGSRGDRLCAARQLFHRDCAHGACPKALGPSAEAGLVWPAQPAVASGASAARGVFPGGAGGLLLDE